MATDSNAVKPNRPSALDETLKIFSEKWTYAVLQELFFGVRRFDDFQRNLDISRSVLTTRLNHLVKYEVIRKVAYQDRPKRYEYKLTESGRAMYGSFVLLKQWGERWLNTGSAGELALVHASCSKKLEAELVCVHCGKPVSAHNTYPEAIHGTP
ncbi:transcriptional regulator [Henriciella barbarensis]|jgi:DNA-binding HxlR family transcriptional regulator|uniref:Transcriptional regulator n=1 Tax=Henriciella barbarensis TaxID=86342 RepID=A0A399R0F2_9PROT|nr:MULTISPECIES: helix-turn-helix domain-containing protein [Henriciella]RIJ24648.1 transcriptional regulator [Henriciella barbarensis]